MAGTSIVDTLSPVRVSIPASVAYDLGAFQKSLTSIAERIGHPECFSGLDCSFMMERDFVVNERSEAQTELRPFMGGNRSVQAFQATPVSVTMPANVGNDIASVQMALANIAGRLGCEACCSGHDVLFLRERELLVGRDLQVRGITETLFGG